MSQNIIDLSNAIKIGQGVFRTCYINPADLKKVIKINHEGSDGNEREYECYKKIKDEAINFFPKCYGFVETNLGRGLVFERIVDDLKFGGKSSLKLMDAIKDSSILNNETLLTKIEKLFDICIKYKILSSSIRPENIMVQQLDNNEIRVLSMDTKSIVHKELIPLVKYCCILQKIKIKRRAKRMLAEIEQELKKLKNN